jgi:hypothetical protein
MTTFWGEILTKHLTTLYLTFGCIVLIYFVVLFLVYYTHVQVFFPPTTPNHHDFFSTYMRELQCCTYSSVVFSARDSMASL